MLIRSLALTLFLLPFRLDAGQDVWTPIGPERGTVTAMAFSVNGRTAYTATQDGGVFKSINSGRSWSRTGDGLRGSVADLEADSKDLEVSPSDPSTVYAATSGGLYVITQTSSH